ncbi:alpha/beta hydrolase [Arthrobacter jiangjiafuii]|uniref:Alpha/beta hydrolase n=1 Tax=Arthrobacter jiangjiafuii TaxID=2817475 RepID=A0A975R107_9MICC|nr:alpha/beta hydrolase [Arthrobacter jiangjiafuii]MBP3042219.1 alpha/beta fold hydrolase [Arthrobacter jiangjiafuii]QWC10011.1 alpha/beta hydrolase [Arthrobacter jiangjiafuii]
MSAPSPRLFGAGIQAPRSSSPILARNNVRVIGPADGPVLLLAQGFGCDQVIWDRLLPYLENTHRIVLFDHVGTGGADLPDFQDGKYSSLAGHTGDLLDILDALELEDVTVVGHTVAGMMALTAAAGSPRIGRLVLLNTSACYGQVPAEGYDGGLTPADMDQILAAVDGNHPLWADSVAPSLLGQSAPSALSGQVAERLCLLDPDFVLGFLRMTLHADVRHLLGQVSVPALILQSAGDPLTPASSCQYLSEQLSCSALVHLNAKGNMPHVNAPAEIAQAILGFLPGSTHAS